MNQPTSTKLSYTIVVIEIVGGEALGNFLKELQKFNLHCIVILKEHNPQLQARFNSVMFDVLDKPVPYRRKRGAALAKGDVVILIEDTTIPGETMLEGLSISFEKDSAVAASGSISIDKKLPWRYQALACTEYGRYHLTVLFSKKQEHCFLVNQLPGNFVCYRREKLNSLLDSNEDGLVEGIINHQLLSTGSDIVMVPKLAATYCREDKWGVCFSTRFHHGWIYAGNLAERKNIGGRAVQSAKSLLLPLVLSSRAIRYMSGMKEINRPLIVALWIIALEFFWSMGEFIGSIFGKPINMEYWR